MLAHQIGNLLNAANLARGLGVDNKTIASYLDLLVDLLLVRRLQPWHRNTGKRLVRSPKIYVRDSGLVHALLNLPSRDKLLGHPMIDNSWEGFAIETLLNIAPEGVEASFYKTASGAEIDLVLTLPLGIYWAIEIKRSLAPKLEKGFHIACQDIQPDRTFVVYPGTESFPISKSTEAINLADLSELLISTEDE